MRIVQYEEYDDGICCGHARKAGPQSPVAQALEVEPRTLPAVSVLQTLLATLRDTGLAVLQAPPGAGKTTRVPLCHKQ